MNETIADRITVLRLADECVGVNRYHEDKAASDVSEDMDVEDAIDFVESTYALYDKGKDRTDRQERQYSRYSQRYCEIAEASSFGDAVRAAQP